MGSNKVEEAMKTTMLCAVASLLSAGVLMGGCMADSGGESEGVTAEGPTVGGSEEVGEAKQGLTCGALYGGETLFAGQQNSSCNGYYTLVEQAGDGNLVLYHNGVGAAWATYAYGAGARTIMQTDGNLVVYTPSNAVLWHSHTYGNPGARLSILNNGNLVIYSTSNQVLWQSGTSDTACFMYKGTNINGGLGVYQACGYSGSWVNSLYPGYPSYQEPYLNGARPWNGGWASTNNYPVTSTTSAAVRNSFISGAYLYGDCSTCVW
jgi:hypothetical protein